MARIPTKEELGGEQYAVQRQLPQFRAQDFSGDAAIGRALAGVGDAAQKTIGAVVEKRREDDDYEVANKIVEFDLAQEKRLDDAKRKTEPEARDFTKTYRSQYDDDARTFMEGIPDRLKPKVDALLVRRAANYEKRAYDFELRERDRYHSDDVSRRLTDWYNDSTLAPERKDANAERGVAVIRASRLPTNTKLRLEREFLEKNDEFAARAEFERRAAAGEDLGPEIEKLRKIPRGSGVRAPSSAGGPSFADQKDAAPAIRSNNPGAQYPGPSATKFGAVGEETLKTGHKIAIFPDAVSGAAAQFDLLSRNYAGKSLADALTKWSGGNNSREYAASVAADLGITPGTKITKEMLADPAFAIPFGKAMAKVEAGSEYPLSDEDWTKAHRWAINGVRPGVRSGRDPGGAEQQAALSAEKSEILGRYIDATPEERMGILADVRKRGIATDFLKIGGEYGDSPNSGEPAVKLDDPNDEPIEDDVSPYRHLSPTTRRKLLNLARTAQRSVMAQKVEGAIVRVRKGEELEADETGRTAFDKAVEHLTPHQKQEAIAKMETARAFSKATRGIQDMTADEAEEAVDRIGVTVDTPENLVAATDRAHRDALAVRSRLEAMRKVDPVATVWKGDPRGRIAPAREAKEAAEKIKALDRNDPDFVPRSWEITIQARVDAQRRTMPDREPRLLTKQEATALIPLPTGTKFSDPQFRTILQKAADTAEKRYGPGLARAALQDAIRWTITGEDEKRMSAGILAKVAVGEPITSRDVRIMRMTQEATDFNLMGPPIQPSPMDAEGQAGGYYGAPARRPQFPLPAVAPAVSPRMGWGGGLPAPAGDDKVVVRVENEPQPSPPAKPAKRKLYSSGAKSNPFDDDD